MTLTQSSHDDLLLGYLLGTLPQEETDRLDERSIADDDFAAQLGDAENDLVDAYVRGKLAPETAERFRAVYLAPGTSPGRRQKVGFAQVFLSFEQRTAAAASQAHATSGVAKTKASSKSWRLFFSVFTQPQWGMAVAALVLLVTTGYLAIANQQLRQRAARAEADQTSLRQPAKQLEKASNGLNSAPGANDTGQPSRHAVDRLHIAAFVLVPAGRGVASLPSVSVPPGTDLVVFELPLEVADFKQYRVDLEDPSTRQVLWRSTELKPVSGGDQQTVSFALSADLLKQGNYILQLTGIGGNGVEEQLSSYPFRARTSPDPGIR